MIVGARLKARSDDAITVAWNVELFSRMKRIKPLAEYLKPPTKVSPDKGAADLRGMFARMAAKRGTTNGDR